MRIEIEHTTTYRYADVFRYSTQYLRLTPYTNPSQRVIQWKLEAPGRRTTWRDAYGNLCDTLVCDDQVTEVKIVARGMVETTDCSGVLPDKGDIPIDVYLRSSPLTAVTDTIRDFAAPFRPADAGSRLDRLHEIAKKIQDDIEYREDATEVDCTAESTLSNGFGVCQDMAHLFIASARAIGIPARYVSGYLYVGESESPFVAGHAWASAWVDNLGWVSFDLANKKCGTDSHVGLAIGIDYVGAAPIRGVRHGGTELETMDVQVRVTQE